MTRIRAESGVCHGDPKGRDDSERRQVESGLGLGTSKFNGGAAIKRLAVTVTPRAVRSRPFLNGKFMLCSSLREGAGRLPT
jgi:hypothetical protein